MGNGWHSPGSDCVGPFFGASDLWKVEHERRQEIQRNRRAVMKSLRQRTQARSKTKKQKPKKKSSWW